MKPILETNRLLLTELNALHAVCFFELNNDSDVIRYTGDEPFESVDAARQFLLGYDQYEKYGMGRWAVILKDNNEFIGWCGLKFNADINEVDIGFRLFKKYWGHGYATEAAKACIAFGFEKLKLKKIIGRVVKQNIASIRILEKCGLKFVDDFNFHSMPGALYEIKSDKG